MKSPQFYFVSLLCSVASATFLHADPVKAVFDFPGFKKTFVFQGDSLGGMSPHAGDRDAAVPADRLWGWEGETLVKPAYDIPGGRNLDYLGAPPSTTFLIPARAENITVTYNLTGNWSAGNYPVMPSAEIGADWFMGASSNAQTLFFHWGVTRAFWSPIMVITAPGMNARTTEGNIWESKAPSQLMGFNRGSLYDPHGICTYAQEETRKMTPLGATWAGVYTLNQTFVFPVPPSARGQQASFTFYPWRVLSSNAQYPVKEICFFQSYYLRTGGQVTVTTDAPELTGTVTSEVKMVQGYKGTIPLTFILK